MIRQGLVAILLVAALIPQPGIAAGPAAAPAAPGRVVGIWLPAPNPPPSALNLASGSPRIVLPSGRVLFVGGASDPTAVTVYDPLSGVSSSGRPMPARQLFPTLALLQDGRVLAAGGSDGTTTQTAAYLYDSNADSWSATGSLLQDRGDASAVTLQNGQVLLIGGVSSQGQPIPTLLRSTEVYDPASGTWSSAGTMPSDHGPGTTATLLTDGRVLVAGGTAPSSPAEASWVVTSVTVFDPATRTWAESGGLSRPRTEHTAALLPSGQVLVAGGTQGRFKGARIGCYTSAELWGPTTGTWTPTGSTSVCHFTSVTLPDGGVLTDLGYRPFESDVANVSEAFDPTTGQWRQAGPSIEPCDGSVQLLPSGAVVIIGWIHGPSGSASGQCADHYLATAYQVFGPNLLAGSGGS